MNIPKHLSKEDQDKLKRILVDLSSLIEKEFGNKYGYYFSLVCKKKEEDLPLNISSIALPKESLEWESWLTLLMTAISEDSFLKHTIFTKLLEDLEQEMPVKPSSEDDNSVN